jgi:hypothetical protein
MRLSAQNHSAIATFLSIGGRSIPTVLIAGRNSNIPNCTRGRTHPLNRRRTSLTININATTTRRNNILVLFSLLRFDASRQLTQDCERRRQTTTMNSDNNEQQQRLTMTMTNNNDDKQRRRRR